MDYIPRWFIIVALLVFLVLGMLGMTATFEDANGQTINDDLSVCQLLIKEDITYDSLVSSMEDLMKIAKTKIETGEVTEKSYNMLVALRKHYIGLRDLTRQHIEENNCLVGNPG